MSLMPDEPHKVRTTDKALVRRLLGGDEAAFTQFFDGHFSRLYRFALRRTNGDADAAEEIVQKTLIVAVRRLHTFRGEATLFTWLCAICRREITAWQTTRGRQTAVMLPEDSPAARDQLAALAAFAAQQPDETFSRNETARLVQVAHGRRNQPAHELRAESRGIAAHPRPEVLPAGVLSPRPWADCV
jgi:RNA polymerase sigma-70 factor (ECF subfamily)